MGSRSAIPFLFRRTIIGFATLFLFGFAIVFSFCFAMVFSFCSAIVFFSFVRRVLTVDNGPSLLCLTDGLGGGLCLFPLSFRQVLCCLVRGCDQRSIDQVLDSIAEFFVGCRLDVQK